MSRNEDFASGTWSMSAFDDLSPEAAWLWIWSWTNPRCGVAGLYDVGKRAMVESKVDATQLDHALAELATAPEHFRVLYEGGVMFVWSRLARWRSKTEPCVRAVVKELEEVGVSHPLRVRWLEVYGEAAWLVRGLEKLKLSIGRASGEPHGSPDEQTGSVSLTGSSPELLRKGKGKGTTTTGFQGEGEVDARARPVEQAALPAGLPTEMEPVAKNVLDVLTRAHGERGGNTPTLRGVGLALVAMPNCDHLSVAQDLEHWALAGNGQKRGIVDWVATYRNFLKRAPAGAPVRSQAARPKQSLNHLLRRS